MLKSNINSDGMKSLFYEETMWWSLVCVHLFLENPNGSFLKSFINSRRNERKPRKIVFAPKVFHTNGLLLPPAVFFSGKAIIILESKCWVVQYLLESSSRLFTKQRSHKGTLKVIRIINTKARENNGIKSMELSHNQG